MSLHLQLATGQRIESTFEGTVSSEHPQTPPMNIRPWNVVGGCDRVEFHVSHEILLDGFFQGFRSKKSGIPLQKPKPHQWDWYIYTYMCLTPPETNQKHTWITGVGSDVLPPFGANSWQVLYGAVSFWGKENHMTPTPKLHTHGIHGTGIFNHIWLICMVFM